jgi:hypothetical protein
MIEATLSLNRLAAGHDLPSIEALKLATLWDDLRTEFEALPRRTAATLHWQAAGDAVLRTDRRRLKIIVKNLVGNALKFTPSGAVVVAYRLDGDGTVIRVNDTGIGIPAEHLSHIFDMFRQVDSSDARSNGAPVSASTSCGSWSSNWAVRSPSTARRDAARRSRSRCRRRRRRARRRPPSPPDTPPRSLPICAMCWLVSRVRPRALRCVGLAHSAETLDEPGTVQLRAATCRATHVYAVQQDIRRGARAAA